MKRIHKFTSILILGLAFAVTSCGEGPNVPPDPNQTVPDSTTPYIGENGNWWIGDYDTGVPAIGTPGGNSIFNGNFYHYKGFKGKKLSVIGDSISTFKGSMPEGYKAYYPKGDVVKSEQMWWGQVCKTTGMKLLRNCAWSGSNVCGDSNNPSALTACSSKRINDLSSANENPDIIIAYIGINDLGLQYDLGEFNGEIVAQEGVYKTFAKAYSLMVNKITSTYPFAEVYCSTLMEAHDYGNWETIKDNTSLLLKWNQVIKDIANSYGCKIIDMHSCGITYKNIEHYSVDGKLHPNANGHKMMGQCVINTLLRESKFNGIF